LTLVNTRTRPVKKFKQALLEMTLAGAGGIREEQFASEVERLGRHAIAQLAEDASPAAKQDALLSAMLSDKVRKQAGEIQALLVKLGRLEEEAQNGTRPACTSVDKRPLAGGDTLLFRDGPPTFKEHNEVVKQLAQLSKEYRQVNKKLEDVMGEKKQLRTDLTAKEKEAAGLQRQLLAAQKVLAETKASHAQVRVYVLGFRI